MRPKVAALPAVIRGPQGLVSGGHGALLSYLDNMLREFVLRRWKADSKKLLLQYGPEQALQLRGCAGVSAAAPSLLKPPPLPAATTATTPDTLEEAIAVWMDWYTNAYKMLVTDRMESEEIFEAPRFNAGREWRKGNAKKAFPMPEGSKHPGYYAEDMPKKDPTKNRRSTARHGQEGDVVVEGEHHPAPADSVHAARSSDFPGVFAGRSLSENLPTLRGGYTTLGNNHMWAPLANRVNIDRPPSPNHMAVSRLFGGFGVLWVLLGVAW